MHLRHWLMDRLLPALITAAGVTLLAAGLLSYASPPTTGALPTPSSTPTALPTPTPAVTPSPGGPSASPAATPTAGPTSAPGLAAPTRVVVVFAGIDLPILSSDYDPPGNPGNYPLCDIAQYLVDPGAKLGLPAEKGKTAYIYAHAREGMFLPLLEASQRDDGAELLGALVQVYTDDDHLFIYEIFRVKRHATDFSLASSVGPNEQRVVLQTSEGRKGTIPKLQVAARLLSVQAANHAEAHPKARPRICA